MILPIFTSNYSIGSSILSLQQSKEEEFKSKKREESINGFPANGFVTRFEYNEGSDSIVQIAKENNLKQVILLESTFIGFKKALDSFQAAGIQLIFGIRFKICNDRLAEDREKTEHKICLFAKNDAGCKELMKLYSLTQTKFGGFLDYSLLKERLTDNLLVVVPFYDSFIHRNALHGQQCLPDLSFCQPIMWLGNHGLPFDHILRRKTVDFAAKNGYDIYYKNRADIDAMTTYKILTNRQGGKAQTLDRPELAGFSSDEFCLESYLEKLDNPKTP
jgi:DNA polymerase III alpha subunit